MRAHHWLPLMLLSPSCSPPGMGRWVGARPGWVSAPFGELGWTSACLHRGGRGEPLCSPLSPPGRGQHIPAEAGGHGGAAPRRCHAGGCPAPSLPVTAPRVAAGPRGPAGSGVPSDGRGDALPWHKQLPGVPRSPGPGCFCCQTCSVVYN